MASNTDKNNNPQPYSTEHNKRLKEIADKLGEEDKVYLDNLKSTKSDYEAKLDREDAAEKRGRIINALSKLGLGFAGMASLQDKNSYGLNFKDVKFADPSREKAKGRLDSKYRTDISELARKQAEKRQRLRDEAYTLRNIRADELREKQIEEDSKPKPPKPLTKFQEMQIKNIQSQIEAREKKAKLDAEEAKRAKEKAAKEELKEFETVTAGLRESQNDLIEIEKAMGVTLDKYDPKKHDFPGKSVPLIGRQSWYSKEARTLESAMSTLFNKTLKTRSGAAVTTPELERLKREFNRGRFSTEEELVGALKRYRRAVESAIDGKEAVYDPKTKKEFYIRFEKEKENRRKDQDKDLAGEDIPIIPVDELE